MFNQRLNRNTTWSSHVLQSIPAPQVVALLPDKTVRVFLAPLGEPDLDEEVTRQVVLFHLELPSLQPWARQMWCLTHPLWKEMKMTRRRPRDHNEQANFPILGKMMLCLRMTCWGCRWRWRACRGHQKLFWKVGTKHLSILLYSYSIRYCNDTSFIYNEQW